ncbi:MAG: BrnT family toxin [Candidatus Binatia bacterium]
MSGRIILTRNFSGESGRTRDEDRFILPGLSATLRLLVVSHTYRKEDEVIRLISARKADRSERAYYSRRWRR